MSSIKISGLTKSYSENSSSRLTVLNNIDLSILDGQFITFFGPNGCGKTTLLKTIAGIEPFDSGSITIDNLNPKQAKSGMIFQNFKESLMPWLTCEENILFPFHLKKRKNHLNEGKARLKEILFKLDINLPLNHYPYQMSGGQNQLTAIIRTLIYQPDVILMDEPFSALDYQTRSFCQNILMNLWMEFRPTILFVSHDLEEAIILADYLVLLSKLPAKVIELKKITLPRPRQSNLYESDDFFNIKKECLRKMKKDIY